MINVTLAEALQNLFSIKTLIFINIGMFLGILFGSMPGLNGNMAITILLPFTFTLPPIPAILMLCAIFFGANFGASISAILINVPGTNAAAATLMDGYPLSKMGFPKKGLKMALVASTFGGFISALSLLFFAPQIGKLAMRVGAPEYFALAILGLSVIASVCGKSLLKGLISGGIGLLISTIGIDGHSGITRFTFGNIFLYNGVKMIAVLIGIYAITEMLASIVSAGDMVQSFKLKRSNKNDRLSFKEIKTTFVTMVKSAFMGVSIGSLPGTGGAIAAFLAYNEAKRCAKPNEKFGEGEIKGIAAPEAANNGATAATLIPLLTLGIPGDAVSATLLGAFTMQGIVVGPRLFEESGPIVQAIMIGIVITQLMIFFQGRYLLPIFVKLLNIPKDLLTSILVMICSAGAFALANQVFDVRVMIVSGIVGYFMQKADIPPVPIILGIVLGPIAESNLRNALVMSAGSLKIFYQRPIALLIILITVLLVVLVKRNEIKNQKFVQEFEVKNSTTFGNE